MANNRDPIYRRIRDDLTQRIDSGSILTGMPLPSEARLAAEWGTSRHSVRTALLALAEDGLLLRRAGRGWFVRDRRRSRSGSAGHVAVVADLDPATVALFADFDLGCVRALPGAEHARRLSGGFLAELLAEPGCRGLLVSTMHELDDEVLAPVRAAGLPLVLVGLPQHAPTGDAVACDFADASRRLVHAAAAAGHPRVAFCGRQLHRDLPPFRSRVDGYRLGMAELGGEPLVWLLPPDCWQVEAIAAWFARQLAAHPEVDACLLDSAHTAACITALDRQRPIPGRLLVGGYGNGALPPHSGLPITSLTAVYEPWDGCYQLAAQRLVARISGDPSPFGLTLVPCRLVPGDSLPLGSSLR